VNRPERSSRYITLESLALANCLKTFCGVSCIYGVELFIPLVSGSHFVVCYEICDSCSPCTCTIFN